MPVAHREPAAHHEQLAAIRGSKVDRISKEEMEEMYRHGDAVMYPEVKK